MRVGQIINRLQNLFAADKIVNGFTISDAHCAMVTISPFTVHYTICCFLSCLQQRRRRYHRLHGSKITKTSEDDGSSATTASTNSTTTTATATASEPAPAAGGLVTLPSTPITNANPLPALSVSDYVVVSSRRTGRTGTEYTLKIKSPTQVRNVMKTCWPPWSVRRRTSTSLTA